LAARAASVVVQSAVAFVTDLSVASLRVVLATTSWDAAVFLLVSSVVYANPRASTANLALVVFVSAATYLTYSATYGVTASL